MIIGKIDTTGVARSFILRSLPEFQIFDQLRKTVNESELCCWLPQSIWNDYNPNDPFADLLGLSDECTIEWLLDLLRAESAGCVMVEPWLSEEDYSDTMLQSVYHIPVKEVISNYIELAHINHELLARLIHGAFGPVILSPRSSSLVRLPSSAYDELISESLAAGGYISAYGKAGWISWVS